MSFFTHCKACGCTLRRVFDHQDGLCSHQYDSLAGCFHKWRRWLVQRPDCPKELEHEDVNSAPYDSPIRAVAIDQWLEQGAP